MNSTDDRPEPTPQADEVEPAAAASIAARAGGALLGALRRHRVVARTLALAVAVAVVGAAYVAGGAPAPGSSGVVPPDARSAFDSTGSLSVAGQPVPAATAGPADLAEQKALAGTGGSVAGGDTSTDSAGDVISTLVASQIVKTGQMSLEVGGIDDAVGRAEAAVTGLGGFVDSSNQYGTGDQTVASITFRIPVAKWDEALADMRKLGSRVLSEQTSTADVTTQVVDLDARISNLQSTETALQAIMARASAIPDVIAVENQLSDTQGQIEELTAESKQLKDQAAMSTLTVSFQLPSSVISQATQDWTLSSQIDQAGAALVRIGQGLATFLVWIVVVALPIGIALALLVGIGLAVRRLRRGPSRRSAQA